MLIKAGVDISRLERNTRSVLGRVAAIFENHKLEIIITSTYEGTHGAGSLHYAHRAFDFRKPDADREGICFEIKKHKGKDFDFVVEFDHYHIEYDPKE